MITTKKEFLEQWETLEQENREFKKAKQSYQADLKFLQDMFFGLNQGVKQQIMKQDLRVFFL